MWVSGTIKRQQSTTHATQWAALTKICTEIKTHGENITTHTHTHTPAKHDEKTNSHSHCTNTIRWNNDEISNDHAKCDT